MRRAVLAAIVLASLVLVTTIARAETAPPGASSDPVSYRWQVAASDLAALGLAIASANTNDNDLLPRLAVGTYALGSPMVHAANGHAGRAVASLGLRIALPALGALIGVSIQGDTKCENCIDDAPPIQGLIFGIGLGGLTALIVDYAVLARPEPVATRSWSPVTAPVRGGATIGVAGRF